jgi:hypothetical protein
VSFAAITFCVASQQVFIIAVVYFLMDSVPKLLDIPSYNKINDIVKRNFGKQMLSETKYEYTTLKLKVKVKVK